MKYALLAGTIILLATGQVLFKLSAGTAVSDRWAFLTSPTFIAALFTYAIATLLWIFVLRVWPLSIAYASQAITIVIVMSLAIVMFGESLSTTQFFGAGLIVCGLFVLASG